MKLPPSYRQERVERLLKELQYEVSRGIMEGEIDESLSFRFIVSHSKEPECVVRAEFNTRPVHRTRMADWVTPYTDNLTTREA
jgi:hypothetical protein